jgi:hypothetical protein
MKLEFATMITEAAEAIDLDVKLRPDYSGRGMYGATTAALIAPSMAEFAAAACEAAARLERRDEWSDWFIDAVRAVRTDNTGRDSIVIY